MNRQSIKSALVSSVVGSLSAALMVASIGGCAGRGKAAIPAGAQRVAAGDGEVIYRSSEAGEVFVYDEDANKIVYSGIIAGGEELQVRPGEDRVLIGQRTVTETPLGDDHRYRIYLKRD